MIPNKHKRALFYDNAAKVIIYLGGIATIIAVLGILVFIFNQAYPLFEEAFTNKKENIEIQKQKPLLVGADEYQTIAYVVTDSAKVDFIEINSGLKLSSIPIDSMRERTVFAIDRTLFGNNIVVADGYGNAQVFRINYNITFDENSNRIVTPEYEFLRFVLIDSLQNKLKQIALSVNNDNEISLVGLTSQNEILIYAETVTQSIFGDGTIEIERGKINVNKEDITAIELDESSKKLIIGTSKGEVINYSLENKSEPKLIEKIIPFDNAPITALSFLIGDQSFIVADSKGNTCSLMRILDEGSDYGWQFVKPHVFEKLGAEVSAISPSQRDKTFIIGDIDGNLEIKHLTSGETIANFKGAKEKIIDIFYTPKSDGVLILYDNSIIERYEIESKYPDATINTLFGKVWYEGYNKPEFVWQSTGGSDDFEPKLNLIPLIMGTFKGTLYALLFAIPIALFGALYTSVFVHPKVKNILKPTVEIMAALPSVVIGFLAGLWLAPLLERILPGVFLVFIISPLMMFLGLYLWKKLPKLISVNFKQGYEVLMLIPLLILGGQIALWLGPYFETYVLGGDYRAWLLKYFNESYDQRNAIVVGFAMGFAVIPIIFTICEDALSSVPRHLTSGSLALGANRWQTAIRVILPTASPGIFSAIMIGFGRAIGETMIVLMATGNTPILDFSPFNGFRTLSANIAVEIPEAPYLGTLYRVLFLSAALLFVLTFIVNTIAEIVRQRLRKKYMDI